jgi:NAD(P)-dependent dehydrogenase (short-subunit alcohol dehydrogenase family)
MELKLAGHTAVIVGGAKGIGQAIALAFAAEGANLALVDRDPEATATAKKIGEQKRVRSGAIVADATSYKAMQTVAKQVSTIFRRIDHIIYAVGIGSGKYGFPFWNLEPEDWGRVMQVNVGGAVNVAHAFSPALIEAKSGTFLFLSSVAGQIGSQTDPPYSASKAALINFAQCAAKDLAPYNVRVNTICPGMIKTALNRAVWDAWYKQQPMEKREAYEVWAERKIKQLIPLNRWQDAEDVAAMAVFLSSDAGKNITGQTINVDGGFVMHW